MGPNPPAEVGFYTVDTGPAKAPVKLVDTEGKDVISSVHVLHETYNYHDVGSREAHAGRRQRRRRQRQRRASEGNGVVAGGQAGGPNEMGRFLGRSVSKSPWQRWRQCRR
jgi:hypothetical protein